MKIVSTKTMESKPQPSTKVSCKGKDKEEDIDLDEDIVIPNWDISTLNPDQIHILGDLLQNKSKQQRLKDKRNKENQLVEYAKNILVDTLDTKVNTSQLILAQLEKVVQKFNEYLNGQDFFYKE